MSENMTIEETINGLQRMIQSKKYIEHNFDGVVDEDVCDRAIELLKKQQAEIRQLKLALDIAKGTCKGIAFETNEKFMGDL